MISCTRAELEQARVKCWSIDAELCYVPLPPAAAEWLRDSAQGFTEPPRYRTLVFRKFPVPYSRDVRVLLVTKVRLILSREELQGARIRNDENARRFSWRAYIIRYGGQYSKRTSSRRRGHRVEYCEVE